MAITEVGAAVYMARCAQIPADDVDGGMLLHI